MDEKIHASPPRYRSRPPNYYDTDHCDHHSMGDLHNTATSSLYPNHRTNKKGKASQELIGLEDQQWQTDEIK